MVSHHSNSVASPLAVGMADHAPLAGELDLERTLLLEQRIVHGDLLRDGVLVALLAGVGKIAGVFGDRARLAQPAAATAASAEFMEELTSGPRPTRSGQVASVDVGRRLLWRRPRLDAAPHPPTRSPWRAPRCRTVSVGPWLMTYSVTPVSVDAGPWMTPGSIRM
jgi:hypothetical protein